MAAQPGMAGASWRAPTPSPLQQRGAKLPGMAGQSWQQPKPRQQQPALRPKDQQRRSAPPPRSVLDLTPTTLRGPTYDSETGPLAAPPSFRITPEQRHQQNLASTALSGLPMPTRDRYRTPTIWDRFADEEGAILSSVFEGARNLPANRRRAREAEAQAERDHPMQENLRYLPVIGPMLLDTPDAMERQVGGAWDAFSNNFTRPLDDTKGGWKYPARVGKIGVDALGLGFSPFSALLTGGFGTAVERQTGLNPDVTGNLLLSAGPGASSAVNAASRARLGAEMGGVRGAARMAAESDPLGVNALAPRQMVRAPMVELGKNAPFRPPEVSPAPLNGAPVKPMRFEPAGRPPAGPVARPPVAPTGTPSVRVAGSPDVPPPPSGFTLDRPAMAMDGERMPSIYQELPPASPGGAVRPLTVSPEEAQLKAMSQSVDPNDVLPVPSNQIGGVEDLAAIDQGRFGKASVPNERSVLDKGVVTNWRGQPVPKVGPVDLVGYIRLQGGLLDQGGELSHMGLTNAARRGMDHLGTEQRFGPLVNNMDGMRLDDAALQAWEAGYFPQFSDRPSINDFLDALRGTHDGYDRRFLPEDHAQLENFNALREERFALDQQKYESGQPVFVDRSVPADEGAPFPPIEAYHEWPAGGPDFAGNINLNKLKTPQDIKRALDFTNRRVGFDGATRGRVANAETERLAGDLGMTVEQLLSRRKGQAVNAEEALAARQLLAKSGNELVNLAKRVKSVDAPGDELTSQFRQAWVRHVAIQEQVAGITAEAGRTLQQFKMAADSRAVRGDVLRAFVEGGGGERRIKDAADILVDAFELEPGQFNTMAAKLAKPTWKDKIKEVYYNFLLSGPQTHVVNTVSNTATALGQIPEHATAAMLGKGRQLFSKEPIDRVTSTEVGQRGYGMVAGLKEGLGQFVKTAATGETPDVLARVEAQAQDAVSGLKGKVLRVPSRLLAAEDELFKAVARRMELHGLAARMAHTEGLKGEAAIRRIAELASNPTDSLLQHSLDYGRYLTFQRPLGPIASKVAALRNDSLVMTAIMPFVRTPTNLLKFAVERSPAAPFLKEWRKDFLAGGAKRDLAVAKALLGTGFGTAIYKLAEDGFVTGGTPLDPVKANFMRANGWQPYSFKIGDTYYSYSRLDPYAMTIGVVADFATKRQGMTESQSNNAGMMITASIMENLGDKTWLSGTADFLQAVYDPERYGPSYLRKMAAGALVPNVLAQTARTIDSTMHDVQSFPDALRARIPFMSQDLPAKRNIWGEPIVREGGLGPDLLSPVATSTDKHDPISQEMLGIDARFSMPSRSVTIDGKRTRLNPQQFEQYSAQSGQGIRQAIEVLRLRPDWANFPTEERAKLAKNTATAQRKLVRKALFDPASQAAPGTTTGNKFMPPRNAPPPPPGFKVDGEAGGINPYRDIQLAVPGVQISSGFRTPGYQADMRRRGYKPATNSAHLSGSALDLIPPRGMTMGQLQDRVRSIYPDAQFLNEGDHLHTKIPGYYGAPALGGAKSAGLNNPLEGMPPPPAGFKIDL